MDFLTGAVTATVTLEATGPGEALELVLDWVTGVTDREVSLRRIAATSAYQAETGSEALAGSVAG